jgi:hypothetical protein
MRWHRFVQQTATEQGSAAASRRTRWLLIAVLVLCLPVVSASAQTSEALSTEPTVSHLPDVFGRLWKIYPNKSDRPAAVEAWNNLKVSDEELFKMREAYPSWAMSSEWMNQKGRNVPPLATWLSERMWEKEPPPLAPPTAAEVSSFLVQPLYLAPRLAFAVTGTIVGGLVYPFDQTTAGKIWDTSLKTSWVWHEFLAGD